MMLFFVQKNDITPDKMKIIMFQRRIQQPCNI